MAHEENSAGLECAGLECIGYAYGAAPVAVMTASLTGAGIPLFRQDYHMGNVAQHMSVAMGGMRLQVPVAYADEAQAFIAAHPPLICKPLGWRVKIILLVIVLLLGGAAMSFSAFFPTTTSRAGEQRSDSGEPDDA